MIKLLGKGMKVQKEILQLKTIFAYRLYIIPMAMNIIKKEKAI